MMLTLFCISYLFMIQTVNLFKGQTTIERYGHHKSSLGNSKSNESLLLSMSSDSSSISNAHDTDQEQHAFHTAYANQESSTLVREEPSCAGNCLSMLCDRGKQVDQSELVMKYKDAKRRQISERLI